MSEGVPKSLARKWVYAVLVVSGLAALALLAYAEEDLRGWLTWRNHKAQWEAKGEKFSITALAPPQVPYESNFAMAPIVFTSYGATLDKDGRHVEDTNIVNLMKMPIEVRGESPTNGIGRWQLGRRADLSQWQEYYRKLAKGKPTGQNEIAAAKAAEAFARRYGLRGYQSALSDSPHTNFPVAPAAQTPANDVLLALSVYDSAIGELRKAAELPDCRFPLNYGDEQPMLILLPHLATMKECSMALGLRSIAELDDGQAEAAADDVALILRLEEELRQEPFLISQLVRVAMLNIAQQPIWEGIVSHHWSSDQLARIEAALSRIDMAADYGTAIRGENACCTSGVEYLVKHGGLDEMLRPGSPETPRCLWSLIPSGWVRQNQVSCSRLLLERYLPVADAKGHAFYPTLAESAVQEVECLGGPYSMVSRLFLPALSKSAFKFAQAQAYANLNLAACAIERYRLAHGQYPRRIQEVVPDFLPSVPTDPFTETKIAPAPLRYKLTSSGDFVIYSIGWNLKDEGGTLATKKSGAIDYEQGDVVWAFPQN